VDIASHQKLVSSVRTQEGGCVDHLLEHPSLEGKERKSMEKLLALWVKVQNRERGQGLVEYALIIALVAILLVGALTLLKGQLSTVFSNISNSL
jgi:pilus assembly protein Flp/PilA